MSEVRTPLTITAASRPRLPRHIKMRHDPSRNRWVILGPERVFSPDEVAVATLKLCDGSRDVGEIATRLAESYNAPADQITADIIALLQDLATKGVVTA